MSRALVLNASYEPLCVVAARRALVLVLGEKAETVAETGLVLHSEHLAGAVPVRARSRRTRGLKVHRVRGSATDLHQRDLPVEAGAWIFEVERPALVLGSRQPEVAVDGVEVIRRRSGGGAIYVAPGGTLW